MDKFGKNLPSQGETSSQYARRLESEGGEEMEIRKALREHFDTPTADMAGFFETFEDARLRHLDLLWKIRPNRTRYSMVKKVAKNLGISDEAAEIWVTKHEKKND